MIIVVTGDRHWTNAARIREVLSALKAELGEFLLIEGGARGADTICWNECSGLRIKTETVWPDWRTHGQKAGPIRNRLMLDRSPALVVAFHNDLAHSRGTKDCVTEAKRRGIPVRVFTEMGEVTG